ncbi:alpha-mannosidase 2-like, partial [Phalaenopsis equestris]|uniref:alpha-mannosidase 2-like n=1 Tax=Phalaenopsis equestris TaxID=78828 RepID=UPI0009E566D2
MPFFYGNRRGGAGGSFGHTFLPTSNTKPKILRKSSGTRRRNPFSPSSTFFAIGITLSLLLFFAVFLRYGVPSHLSSSSSSSSSSNLKNSQLVRRPSIRRSTHKTDGSGAGAAKRSGGEISVARVDITTKDLYDRIEFLDIDGGAWKQGWQVKYDGNEWDEEKLKVFVVPHSHNDPGWKLTVDEYYNRQSRHILDTIVESLSRDARRKFIWEEMSYLEKWWRDASDLKRERFTNLVKNGQLEIVGGGWVMNDEVSFS